MNNTIKVNNLAGFEFWLGMFKPRTQKWQRQTLARLNKHQSVFESEAEREDKMKALKFLLGA